MRLDRLDRWLGPFLMVLAVIWLWLTYTYIPGARSETEPGPQAFPVLLGATLLGLGVLITASAFLAARHAGAEDVLPAVMRREVFIVGGIFALLVLYAFLLEKAGFVLSTPIVIVLAMRVLLRRQSWRLTLFLAAGTTLCCWLLFAVLLEAPLPQGSWRWLFF
ncbi:MAG: tripartite tricarboxylate transporter TctB family protein [Betaproteobacteria bacterium]|nr:tripartite tricarboxylate transporter TctB family protein [Betaproteobacteria bacterium]MDH3413801.1 tripartite tricarboxylate transporter TctB family protein [Gammaproteobacteria bacterium]